MSAKTIIHEILGAVTYWVDRNGKPYQVSSHLDFGAKTTGLTPGAGPGPSTEDGRIYAEMFRRGWLRVSIMSAANEFMVDFRGELSRAQRAWIEDEAADRQLRVVDDQGREMMNFSRAESVAKQAVNKLLENDEIDPKSMVDRLFKDGEYLGVYVTDKEDCTFLTDRWGEAEGEEALPPNYRAAIARLRPHMHDEITFVVKRGVAFGLLFEWEFLDPNSDRKDEVEDAWMHSHGRVPTHDEAVSDLINRAKQLGQQCPDAEVYISVGSHNFGGNIALRAFLTNPTAEKIKAVTSWSNAPL